METANDSLRGIAGFGVSHGRGLGTVANAQTVGLRMRIQHRRNLAKVSL